MHIKCSVFSCVLFTLFYSNITLSNVATPGAVIAESIDTKTLIWSVILLFFFAMITLLIVILVKFRKEDDTKSETLRYVSSHDSLMSLYNRIGILKFLDVTSKFNPSVKYAAICLDVNDFKYVNYVYGELFGDKMLCEISVQLKKIFNGNQAIARVGVNEFVIVDFEAHNLEVCKPLLKNLVAFFNEGIVVEDQIMPVKFSAGVSFYPEDAADPSVLLQYSHMAMLGSKDANVPFQLYHPNMTADAHNRIQILKRFEQSLNEDNGSIKLVYQPIIASKYPAVRKVEALMRWDDQVLGFVPPDKFISIIEESPLTTELNRWVLKEAIKQISLWKNQGLDVTVAVNISRFDMYYKELISDLENLIAQYSISPTNLVIEILESTLFQSEDESLFNAMERLKNQGFTLAIDDFGTGYSNFKQMSSLPIDIVKIDKSLIQELHADAQQFAICQAIYSLCNAMGKKCVVEGVENIEQFNMTRDMGIDFFQGYYIHKPVTVDQLMRFWSEGGDFMGVDSAVS
jgi:diguanylate cyclase (GGDEF)-like protein